MVLLRRCRSRLAILVERTRARVQLPALFAVALLWLGQGYVRVEGIEPHTPPLLDAFRQLADAERDKHKGAATISPESLAALHLQRFAGLRAVALVDREYGIRWIQTRSSVSLSLADLQSFEQACDVLLRRPIEPSPTLLNRRELRTGGPGFIVAVPVRDRTRVVSFVVGILHEDSDTAGFTDAAADRP